MPRKHECDVLAKLHSQVVALHEVLPVWLHYQHTNSALYLLG